MLMNFGGGEMSDALHKHVRTHRESSRSFAFLSLLGSTGFLPVLISYLGRLL